MHWFRKTLDIELNRFHSTEDTTIGILRIDGKFECFTLEDGHRNLKIPGVTRIPKGTYEIELRKTGGMTKRYAERFPEHEGMLWLQDVPDFTYVYIHTGNTHEHTDGCILVGRNAVTNTVDDCTVGRSTVAYRMLYSKIIDAMDEGKLVTITITEDEDV